MRHQLNFRRTRSIVKSYTFGGGIYSDGTTTLQSTPLAGNRQGRPELDEVEMASASKANRTKKNQNMQVADFQQKCVARMVTFQGQRLWSGHSDRIRNRSDNQIRHYRNSLSLNQ
uniref:(northern house mosquito) hypothetical protein n=1 Tax=Culex pipiens TaxID=7175 RepID=A0A8D8CHR2_CULPI